MELSVRYGSRIGNYTCAGQATQQLDARSVLHSEFGASIVSD